MIDLLQSNSQELSQIMTRDYGKSIHFANFEVQFAASCCQYYANNAEKLLQDEVIETPNEV
jgi:succinate-semialdehyde dehydrogenase/glutarate-semialdehyde dehydrogenase